MADNDVLPTAGPTNDRPNNAAPIPEQKDMGLELLRKLKDELITLFNEKFEDVDKRLNAISKAINVTVTHDDAIDGEKGKSDKKVEDGVVDYKREEVEFIKGNRPINNPRGVDNTAFIMKCLTGKATEDEIYRTIRAVVRGGKI